MTKPYLIAAATLLPLAALGCGTSDVLTLKESTTTHVGTGGGDMKSADGKLTIRASPQAVTAALDVTIETNRGTQLDRLVSPLYEITPVDFATRTGLAFEYDVSDQSTGELTLASPGAGGEPVPMSGCTVSNGKLSCNSGTLASNRVGVFSTSVVVAPPAPPPPPPVMGLMKIYATLYFACAHHEDLTLTCWGAISNEIDGDTIVTPGGPFVEVSQGEYHHTCARREDGTVACFGKVMFDESPPLDRVYKSFSAGGFHNCGILPDDTIECLGYAEYGELEVPPGTYKAVEAGITHNCAIRSDDTVVCWGSISNAPTGTFIAIRSGGGTCAQRADLTLECWGINGTTPAGAFVDFSVGLNHACGLHADGTPECWGEAVNDVSLDPPPGVRFRQLSAGGNYNCGITIDERVMCWGDDLFGRATPPF